MAEKVPNARHNCDLNTMFQFFQEELERNYGFVFKSSGKYQFVTVFDEKVPCLTESDNPSKSSSNNVKPRGMYWIYPNMNRDTGEYWPVLKGHRFGVTDIEISIAFADHYKNVIKPQRDSNPNYKPPSKEDVDRRVREFEEAQKKHLLQQEKELLAAQIAIRIEWQRAGKVIDDSFFNNKTGSIQTFKRDIRQMPYMVEKNLEPYGAKIMRKDNFTRDEAIEAVKRELPESATNQQLLVETVENVLAYQKHFINFEPEIEGEKKKGFDLRKSRAVILAPLIDTNNKVVNLQRITHHRQKKRNKETNKLEEVLHKGKYFFDKAKTKDAFLPVSKNPDVGYEVFNPNAKNYLIKEGWATAISARKALDAGLELGLLGEGFTAENTQVLASYSKSNISSVAELIRSINPKANIFVGYDNDAGQTLESGLNPGLQEACHNFSLSGVLGDVSKHEKTRITLPPVFQNKLSVSDWDDARQYLGVERLAAELAKELNNAVKRIDNKIPEVAYAINRYNRQREAYAAKFPNKEYQPNYGIVIAQSDEKYLELQNIRAKNQANIENYNANIEKRKQDLSKANYDGPAGTGSTKSYAKPKYQPPSFDKAFDDKSTPTATAPVSSPVMTLEGIKSYMEILSEIDVTKVQNDVLKVVATADGHQKIKAGDIEFEKMGAKEPTTSTNPSMDSMQNTKVHIDVSKDINKDTVKLQSVDRSTIPEQNLQQGIDHQSYAKSAIFTAFWLHSAEMYKARKLIHEAGISNADVEGSIAVAEDKLNKAQEEVSKKRSYPELFVISASDSEYRASIMKVLSDLEAAHPEWQNLKTFRENLTDRTIAFDQLNLDTLKIKNKVVHLIVSNVTNDQNYLKVQESLTTLLDTSNSLSLDRQQKFNLVNSLSKTLNNMAKLLDEPPVFQRLNDFFTRFEKRVDDLVLGDGLKLYGIEPQNLNKTNERGQSFDM